MPIWAWLIALFVGMTATYFCGYFLGVADSDRAPSQKAWIETRKYGIDAQAETRKYEIDKEHEFNLELMERGVYDHVITEEDDEEEDVNHGS